MIEHDDDMISFVPASEGLSEKIDRVLIKLEENDKLDKIVQKINDLDILDHFGNEVDQENHNDDMISFVPAGLEDSEDEDNDEEVVVVVEED